MIRKVVLSAFLVSGFTMAVTASQAASMKTTCVVSASSHGGKRFATMKCSKKISFDGSAVRSTVWEKDDKKAYNNLARLAGRRFTCDMSLGSTTRDTNIETTHYNLTNCK